MADRLTIAYLSFVLVLVIVRHGQVRHALAIGAIHLTLIASISLLAMFRGQGSRTAAAIGNWYPVLLFGFFFEEIGFIVHAIHPGWFDRLLISAEYSLFGVHPTVWIEQYSNYAVTEVLQLAYTSYLFLTLGLAVYFSRRGERTPFQVLLVSTCVAYYLGYLIFVLFPIESPYHTLRTLQKVELTGGPFTAVINWIERYGRVHGGAFPSAHVSGSVVVLLCAWRYARRVGYWLTPVVIAICIATIYGRYHYVVDVVAGIGMAIIGFVIGTRLVRAGRERRRGIQGAVRP
ncbi:MAG: phosphatase PAP2 family protein [Acidobacteriota bacterium]